MYREELKDNLGFTCFIMSLFQLSAFMLMVITGDYNYTTFQLTGWYEDGHIVGAAIQLHNLLFS